MLRKAIQRLIQRPKLYSVENMDTAEVTLGALCDPPPDADLPPLDRIDPGKDIVINDETLFWRENGYLKVPNLIPHDLLDAYVVDCQERDIAPHGWNEPNPYTHEPLMRDIACHRPLMDKLEMLIGTPMGLNLALTGWRSTTRTWHQDDYLNPPYINCHYAAVWIALDDVHPDAGPFQFVPCSHRWPLMRGDRVQALLPEETRFDPDWPTQAEQIITDLFDAEINASGIPVETFCPKKGDALIWHARLAHRGSLPKDKSLERRSLIAHYSAIALRTDLPRLKRHGNQGWYFLLNESEER